MKNLTKMWNALEVGDTITMKFDSVPETATITEISPF